MPTYTVVSGSSFNALGLLPAQQQQALVRLLAQLAMKYVMAQQAKVIPGGHDASRPA